MRIRVRYTGRVQGVGFRATARHVAAAYPVTGWVRNEPDGAVLMEVQGDQTSVKRVLAGIRDEKGHGIRHEDCSVIGEVGEEAGFEVRH